MLAAYKLGGAAAARELGCHLPELETLDMLITQAVGEASMCWSTIRTHGAGVFMSELAIDVAQRLRDAVLEEVIRAYLIPASPGKCACVLQQGRASNRTCEYGIAGCSCQHVV